MLTFLAREFIQHELVGFAWYACPAAIQVVTDVLKKNKISVVNSPKHSSHFFMLLSIGPNFIELLNGKQIIVLDTVADKRIAKV